ncbi:MAG: hypothetical protein IKR17_10795 [Bacteroidales bacterium]|nr:hypothetical protein [Bacteroidales bacterium]
MSQIVTTDNSNKQIDSESDLLNLQKIADIKIGNLKSSDNRNLLVFPRDLNQHGDRIGDSNIITLRDNNIATGNIMGFVGINDTQIDIRSRFAQDDADDYFLHYMLQRVFAINLFDIKHTTTREQIIDFLLYLFPHFLRKALAQGVFKKYQRFEHNDANVRGPIDVARHIRMNTPFRGTVAYTTREHSYDNHLTQLIRHTIEYIKAKPRGRVILSNDSEVKKDIAQIVAATPTYNVRDRSKIVNLNLRSVNHPYYSAYTGLQRLCMQILRHESLKYGQENDKIYGILFDGAWLWEEYLATVLESADFKHPQNKESKGGIKMFDKPEVEDLFDRNSRRLYPDFWKNDFIIDAKYKHLEKGVRREDLYQVVTYMHCMKARHGGFLYPVDHQEKTNNYQLANDGGLMHIIGMKVQHDATSFVDYVSLMKTEEQNLTNEIKDMNPQ